MPWWAVLLVVVAAVIVLDRMLLKMESRGWIFYRKTKPTGGGPAMLGIANELFHPAQHVAIQDLEQQTRRVQEICNEDPEAKQSQRDKQ